MTRHRIFGISFASIYRLYVLKAERKNHGATEVDQVITWLTGYDAAGLQRTIADEVDLETFFARAPRMNPHATLITGVICGIRVEEIEDPLMQQIRYMDKLVDEVARGKKMTSILRGADAQTASAALPGTFAPIPAKVGRPAARALEAAGFRTIEDLDGASERAILALHGVGPRAIPILREHGAMLAP